MTAPSTPDILEKILRRKQEEVADRKTKKPETELARLAEQAPAVRGFFQAVAETIEKGSPAVIAEIKKASPSKGVIREDYDPAWIAANYSENGATCLSILTDRDFFQGDEQHLIQAREACQIPVLRKDFIVDSYQVYESRSIGADCILLIVAALEDRKMQRLAGLAQDLGMDVLVEVHDREELERAMMLRTPLIGINNRDLRTFRTDLETTITLLTDVFPDRIVVTESGIHSREHILMMRKNDVNAFLVGEAFMTAENPGIKLKELFSSDNA